MSWRAGASLFREMWPLIQAHIPEEEFRVEFLRDLLLLFFSCDVDPTDVRGLHPEVDRVIEDIDRPSK